MFVSASSGGFSLAPKCVCCGMTCEAYLCLCFTLKREDFGLTEAVMGHFTQQQEEKGVFMWLNMEVNKGHLIIIRM